MAIASITISKWDCNLLVSMVFENFNQPRFLRSNYFKSRVNDCAHSFNSNICTKWQWNKSGINFNYPHDQSVLGFPNGFINLCH